MSGHRVAACKLIQFDDFEYGSGRALRSRVLWPKNVLSFGQRSRPVRQPFAETRGTSHVVRREKEACRIGRHCQCQCTGFVRESTLGQRARTNPKHCAFLLVSMILLVIYCEFS